MYFETDTLTNLSVATESLYRKVFLVILCEHICRLAKLTWDIKSQECVLGFWDTKLSKCRRSDVGDHVAARRWAGSEVSRPELYMLMPAPWDLQHSKEKGKNNDHKAKLQ